MAAAYRADTHDEPVLETREGDLVPAVRARLVEICERGEVLAQARPPWLGKPAVWLLLTLLPAAVAGPVLVWSFGSLRAGSLVAAGAVALGLWMVGASAMTARSWWHWRGATVPPGVYLFVVGLLEVRGPRLRLWSASRLRMDQRGADVDLDLTPGGRVRLSACVPSVARTLVQERERLELVQATTNGPTMIWHEPLASDLEASGWRPVAGEVRPRTDGELQRWPVVLAWLAALVAIGAHDRVRLRSDAEGIRRAQAGRDITALRSYLDEARAPLQGQADRALVELLVQRGDDSELVDYLDQETSHGEPLRRVADEALAARLLRPGEPPQWVRRWSRLGSPPAAHALGTARAPQGLSVRDEQAELQRYARTSPHRRDAIREQAFRLSLHEQAEVDCEMPPIQPDPDLSAGFHQEVQGILRPLFHLRRGERCGRIGELALASAQAAPAALRERARESLRQRFAEVQQRASSALGETPELRRLVGRLLDHLAAHPDTPRRWTGEGADDRTCRQRPADPDWRPLLDTRAGSRPLHRWAALTGRLEQALPPEIACADTPPAGPRLELRSLAARPPKRDAPWPVEATLTLPDLPAERVRLEL